jgi:hypothetical protein
MNESKHNMFAVADNANKIAYGNTHVESGE